MKLITRISIPLVLTLLFSSPLLIAANKTDVTLLFVPAEASSLEPFRLKLVNVDSPYFQFDREIIENGRIVSIREVEIKTRLGLLYAIASQTYQKFWLEKNHVKVVGTFQNYSNIQDEEQWIKLGTFGLEKSVLSQGRFIISIGSRILKFVDPTFGPFLLTPDQFSATLLRPDGGEIYLKMR